MRFTYCCSECGRVYEMDPGLMTCPDCRENQTAGEPLRGVLEVRLEGEIPSSGDLTQALLPVPFSFFPPLPAIKGKLWRPARLREELSLPKLFIMDDGANPTGSFKDRASVLVSAYARQCHENTIVLASTGNAGSSMAGIGAAAGQKVILFLPEKAPPAKMIQSLQYGATLYIVKGNYDKAYDLSLEYSALLGGVNRNTAWNPLTMEGKKTVSIDIYLQLGKRAPDHVFVPVGDGCILGGVYKGFKDLLQFGLIKKMPLITAVQAEGSCALYRAWKNGSFDSIPASTLADSLSVDIPRNGYTALGYLKEFNGRVITVTDRQILEAQQHLASRSGLFSEPAGAAAWAGVKKIHHTMNKGETVVVLATGTGLKDTGTAQKGITIPVKAITTIKEIGEVYDQSEC